MTTTHVSILLFDDCDLLDAGGPYEVFLTASRMAERSGLQRPFNIDMVSMDGKPVTAYGGLGLTPTASPEILEQSDIVIVPGAVQMETVLEDGDLLGAISGAVDREGSVVASVCTGAFLLGAIGALDDRPWTTHWEDIDLLAKRIGSKGATRGVRWVDDGAIVTGGALSSGIAMSLHLVARFAGQALADRTATQLDYDWNNNSKSPDISMGA